MANLFILDGNGDGKYLKTAGAGTDGDPHIPDQTIALPTGASTAAAQASALTQLEAIVAALGGTLTVDGSSVTIVGSGGNSVNFAKEGDNWNAADYGVILFARDVDTSPEKYRAIQVGADGHLKVTLDDELPDTAAGDLAAIVAALGGTLTVDGSGVTQPVSVATLPALAAGTNNIGDVDVLTLPAVTHATVTVTTQATTEADSGDNTLIAAPAAGNRLVIASIMVQNESSTATTILLKDGMTTKRRALLQNQGDGVSWKFEPGREWRLGEAAALVLNLSGANSHGVTVDHWTETV